MGAKATKALMASVENPNDADVARTAFDFFDRSKNGLIDKKEFVEITKILVSEDVIQNDSGKKVEAYSHSLFEKHDRNKDGVWSFEDFHTFIKEITGTPLNSNQGAAAPVMNTRVMDFYLKYTRREKDGSLKVEGLPREWVELFKASGIKPKELKDPETVVFLLDTMDQHLKEIKGNTTTKTTTSTPSISEQPEIHKGQNRSAADRSAAPLPPSGGAPPPPPPGPPPPPSTTGTTPRQISIGANKKGNTAPTAAAPPKKDVFAEIREGKKLKPVEDRELDELDEEQKETLANLMNKAMVARRGAIVDDDESEDDWDEWD